MPFFSLVEVTNATAITFTDAGNGSVAELDMRAPVDHIALENKWVLTSAGNFCWYTTAAHHIYCAQTRPATATAITAAIHEQVEDKLFTFAAMGELLRLYATRGGAVALVLRATDVIPAVSYAAIIGDNGVATPCAQHVARWWALARVNTDAQARVANAMKHLTSLFVVNAIIRAQTAGHSFITADAQRKNTVTSRALAVGGAFKADLSAWCVSESKGHDCWHPLSDRALNGLCDAVSGHVPTPVVALRTAAAQLMHQYLAVSESLTDRWPQNQLGLSALHLGLDFCRTMFADIQMRMVITGGDGGVFNFEDTITTVKTRIDDSRFTREQLVALKAVITPALAIAAGYVAGTSEGRESIEAAPSISKIVKAQVGQYAIGKGLYTAVQKRDFDAEAVSGAIRALAATLTAVAVSFPQQQQ